MEVAHSSGAVTACSLLVPLIKGVGGGGTLVDCSQVLGCSEDRMLALQPLQHPQAQAVLKRGPPL